MLEFYQDGKRITIDPIWTEGKVGQPVIFGERVSYGENPDPEKYPLSKYQVPSFFTIVEKQDGKNGYYILEDSEGNRIKMQSEYSGPDGNYLYDAQEWLTWNDKHERFLRSTQAKSIKRLEDHIKLLKDILIKQGIRTVTEDQAKRLGI